MKSYRSFVTLLLFGVVLALAGCSHKVNLDRMEDVRPLEGDEVQVDLVNLERRVTQLFDILRSNKITTYNTGSRLRPFFQSDPELVEFIATYAAEFRDLNFRDDRLHAFRIRDIQIEQNGVVGLVRIDLTGRFYAFLPATIREVQEWRKTGGQWFLVPTPR